MSAPSFSKHGSAVKSLEQRGQLGLEWRQRVPLATQAAWHRAARRRDPVEILTDQGKNRIEELLPVRYARMKSDAFAFLRGAAAIMAADLAALPATGLRVPVVRRLPPRQFWRLRIPRRHSSLRHQ
jgi:hypothetical protein